MNLAPNHAGEPRRASLPTAIRLGAIATVTALVSAFALSTALPARADDAVSDPATMVVEETTDVDPSAATTEPPAETEQPPADAGVAEEAETAEAADDGADGADEPPAEGSAADDHPSPAAARAVKAATGGPVALEAEAGQPLTAGDDHFEMSQDTTLSVMAPGLLINDANPDGDGLYADLFTTPSAGALVSTSPWGEFVFTPPAGFTGPAVFQYSVTDDTGEASAPATVTVDVKPSGAPVLLPPQPVGDNYYYAPGKPLYIVAPGVLANDAISDPVMSLTLADMPAAAGTVDIHDDGGFLFTPASGASGTWWFDYRVCTAGGCADAQVRLLQSTPQSPPSGPIGPGGELPVAVDDAFQVVEGQSLEVVAPGVLGNDHDPEGDPFEILDWTQPQGSLQLSPDGALLYSPPAGFLGVDSFQYRLEAPQTGGIGEWATVEIEVLPTPNTPPVAIDDYFTTAHETDIELSLCGNDTDADGDPIGAGLVGNIIGGSIVGVNGQQCWFDFAPAPGFTGEASFTYYAMDRNDGQVVSIMPATVRILVGDPSTQTNTLPVAVDDVASTPKDTPLTLDDAAFVANDFDADGDALAPYVWDVIGAKLPGEYWSSDAAGFHYTPAPGFTGTRQFTVQVSDGTGTVTSTLSLAVVGSSTTPTDPEGSTDPEDPTDPTDPGDDGSAPGQPEPGLPSEEDEVVLSPAPSAAADGTATTLAATGSEAGATVLAAALLTLAGFLALTIARVRRRATR